MPNDIVPTPAAPVADPQPAAPANLPVPAPAAPASQANATDEQIVKLSPAALKQRLDETREAERRKILGELGFQSIADGKNAAAALKELRQAQMSEQEKLQARLKELETQAARAAELETLYANKVERDFARLPENVRNAIDKQAAGNARERERLMAFFEDAGILVGNPQPAMPPPAPPAPIPQAPAAPPAPATVAPKTPAPPPAAARTKFDEWAEMRASRPLAAGAFYQQNRIEIEASRPKQ